MAPGVIQSACSGLGGGGGRPPPPFPPSCDRRPAPAAVVRWPPGGTGFPSTSAIAVHLGGLRPEIVVVYFRAMKKFFLFVLVAVLVAWVAKKVREV